MLTFGTTETFTQIPWLLSAPRWQHAEAAWGDESVLKTALDTLFSESRRLCVRPENARCGPATVMMVRQGRKA